MKEGGIQGYILFFKDVKFSIDSDFRTTVNVKFFSCKISIGNILGLFCFQ